MAYNYNYHKGTRRASKRKPTIAGIVVLCSLGIALVLAIIHPYTALAPLAVINQIRGDAKPTDLLTEYDWSHFAGASQDASGVHITALGRAIVNQDGSGGQANPPVNVRGPHLKVTGNFTISAEVAELSDQWVSLQFYGGVPIVYDEWRYEPPSLRLRMTTKEITLSIWDGKRPTPISEKKLPGNYGNEAKLAVERSNKSLKLLINGKVLASVPYRGIFNSEQVWFGADAEVGHLGWTLKTLDAVAGSGGNVAVELAPKLAVKHDDPESLRNLSAQTSRQLPIGAAISLNPLLTDSQYRALAAGQFSMLTPENDMKAQFIHPQKAVYSFTDADSLVDFAKVNNLKVHGHALVFGEANPRWMIETPKAERQQMMIDHIKTIVSRYRGLVAEWDVINEPLADNEETDEVSSDLRNHIWYEAMGQDYIAIALRTARAADPSAKLYINEWGLEEDGDRWDAMLALLSKLKDDGVPVDGLGFQAHVYEDTDAVEQSVLSRHIRQLATLGIEARISELDVTGVDEDWQADQYAEILETCMSEPNCKSFAMWGVSDAYGSTTEMYSYPPDPGDDLLWDSDSEPKTATRFVQEMLKNF